MVIVQRRNLVGTGAMTAGASAGVGETVGVAGDGEAPGCEIPSCVGLSPLQAVNAKHANTAIKNNLISNLWENYGINGNNGINGSRRNCPANSVIYLVHLDYCNLHHRPDAPGHEFFVAEYFAFRPFA